MWKWVEAIVRLLNILSCKVGFCCGSKCNSECNPKTFKDGSIIEEKAPKPMYNPISKKKMLV